MKDTLRLPSTTKTAGRSSRVFPKDYKNKSQATVNENALSPFCKCFSFLFFFFFIFES